MNNSLYSEIATSACGLLARDIFVRYATSPLYYDTYPMLSC